jgi:general secretion pathway protein C
MVRRLTNIRPALLSLSKLDTLAPWLLFLTIGWLCWQLASVFWLLITPPTAPQARMVALGGGSTSNIPNVIGFKLFAENSSASGAQSQPNVPMTLEGVFVAQPESRSAAVINVNNTSLRYRVGQKIDGTSYQLFAVSWNQVTLQGDDGTMQQLKFGDSNASAISNAPVTGSQSALNANQQAQAALSNAIQQMKINPNAYLGQMGLSTAGGRGYEITNNVPANVRAQMGLRAGDKIISVNGQPVGNPTMDAQLLQQVQQSHNAQVQIQRGEQTLTIQQNF